MAIALTLQVDTFFAPLIAFTALQPHTLCSWGTHVARHLDLHRSPWS